MLAALSIIDFAGKQSQQNAVKNTNFHEFGLESDSQSVMFADFGIETNNIICKPLSMMAILNSYLNNRDASHRSSQKWAKDKSSILGDSFGDLPISVHTTNISNALKNGSVR